ncbi:MAG: hypothetical protein IJM35_00375 [Bacteroidales bacterium]|nr:hypothetical protein [Bacteroidales bacterium]
MAVSLTILAACGPKRVGLLSEEGVSIRGNNASLVESSAGKVAMKNIDYGTNGFAVYTSNHDWTPYKAMRWKVENRSDKPVLLWVRLVQDGVDNPGNVTKKGVLLHKYMLDPCSTRTITMDFPAPAPHPGILEDFRLMRNDPYGRLTGFHSTEIDYSHIAKVTFFNYRSYPDAEWVVSDIELIPGRKKLPEVMELTADGFFPFIDRYAFTTDSVELPDGVDKPVMIGEFHFGAMDRGMFHCSLIEVETQERRAEAYVRYVESALRHPNIIGVHWHQYSDQATTGRFDGENFQVGFTDVCDTPYPETVAGIRKVGYRMYDIRNGK